MYIMKEAFKTITDFPDYEVSNCGRVRTKSRMVRYTHARTGNEHWRVTEHRLLKIHFNDRTGYKFCQLYLNKKMYNRTIHKLVAQEFVLNPLRLEFINHKDGNKHNNISENLEWCTNEYNHEHATLTGLKARGESISTSKLTSNMVYAIKYFIIKGFSHSELSIAFRVSRPTISLIAEGKSWKHIALTGNELTIEK
jgi:hypothetical protein